MANRFLLSKLRAIAVVNTSFEKSEFFYANLETPTLSFQGPYYLYYQFSGGFSSCSLPRWESKAETGPLHNPRRPHTKKKNSFFGSGPLCGGFTERELLLAKCLMPQRFLSSFIVTYEICHCSPSQLFWREKHHKKRSETT